MKRSVILLAACCAMCLCTGCVGRALKEGVGVATGAKGVTIVVREVPGGRTARPLGVYKRFVVEPFKDNTGTGVPAAIKSGLAVEVRKALAEKRIPNGSSGKTLTIRGTFFYYEDANNTTDQLFGPFEEVIARVQLADGSRVVGEADCVGRSTTTVNQGPEKKAQGLAKAIVDWIDKHYPPR